MATHTHVTPDTEPTPEFDAQCLTYVRGWQQGDIQAVEVVAKLKDLIRNAVATGHIANEARAEHLSGYMQHYIGNLNASIVHYDRARELFSRVGNRPRTIVMDINQGENYRYRGDFKRARVLYKQAYKAAEAIGDARLQSIAITNEGLMLISLRDFDRAESALRKGLDLTQYWQTDTNLDALLTEVHFGLAQVAIELNAHELAWEHAHYSLDHARHGQNLHSMGLAYRILGESLTVLKIAPDNADFETPEQYFKSAMDIFREIDAEAEVARTMYSHACSYALRKRRRHAAQLFRDAMVLFTRLGMTDDAANAAEAQLRVI